jgi:hypothetical protein
MTLITTHAHLSCVPCNSGSRNEIQQLLNIVGGMEDGFAMLDRLSKDGFVDRVRLGGKGRKQPWFLTNKEEGKDAI